MEILERMIERTNTLSTWIVGYDIACKTIHMKQLSQQRTDGFHQHSKGLLHAHSLFVLTFSSVMFILHDMIVIG